MHGYGMLAGELHHKQLNSGLEFSAHNLQILMCMDQFFFLVPLSFVLQAVSFTAGS